MESILVCVFCLSLPSGAHNGKERPALYSDFGESSKNNTARVHNEHSMTLACVCLNQTRAL